MGQREDFEAEQSLAEQGTRPPVAWRYMLGDGKWRYQREWSNGAVMHPVYELTPEAAVALSRTSFVIHGDREGRPGTGDASGDPAVLDDDS